MLKDCGGLRGASVRAIGGHRSFAVGAADPRQARPESVDPTSAPVACKAWAQIGRGFGRITNFSARRIHLLVSKNGFWEKAQFPVSSWTAVMALGEIGCHLASASPGNLLSRVMICL